MKRLLVKLGFRIGDPYDWEPTPWRRLRLWWSRHLTPKPNARCNKCGYRGRLSKLRPRAKWCPACWEDENGVLVLDRRSDWELNPKPTDSEGDRG